MSASQTHIKSASNTDISDGPPPLNYSLNDRKRSIAITWSIILADSCLLPIIMFYSLWFTKLSHETVFNILSSIFGLPSFVQFAKRTYYLTKKDSTCRPIGGSRFSLDCFQISFFISINIITAQIVVAVVQNPPVVPLFAMVTSTMLFMTGFQLSGSFFLYLAGAKIPFRLSSLPAGSKARPAVYTIVEDIVAVDGGGGQRYREELNARYEASPMFRRMMNRLDGFWGIGALATAGSITAMLWTIPEQIGYWIGWSVPFMWAALWAYLTIHYVRSCLSEEKAMWKVEAMRMNTAPLMTLTDPSLEGNDSYQPYV